MDKNSIRVSLFIVYYNPYFCKCWIKIPVESLCLLRESKITINIPPLTIHCASNLPCADARAVRPYMQIACTSYFNINVSAFQYQPLHRTISPTLYANLTHFTR